MRETSRGKTSGGETSWSKMSGGDTDTKSLATVKIYETCKEHFVSMANIKIVTALMAAILIF